MSAENREKSRELPAGFVAKQFQSGQSGNPGGRPKKTLVDEELTKLLEALDGKEAKAIAKTLIAAAKENFKAAQLVAERTQGKPIQKVEHSGPEGGALNIMVCFGDGINES